MSRSLLSLVTISLLFVARIAAAQTSLGELLDAGANKVSPEEFRRELAQQVVTGETPTGGKLEVIYMSSGVITGVGTVSRASPVQTVVNGAWVIDDSQRICTSISINSVGSGGGSTPVVLPPRCQFWFKHGDYYYLSESDSDRHARIIQRAVKPAGTARSIGTTTAASGPLILPKSMKGMANREVGNTRTEVAWSLTITKTKEDGTFEGLVTFAAGQRCYAKDLPVTNGVVRNAEVRFNATMTSQCAATFTLHSGRYHLLEGEFAAEFFRLGTWQVWLDPDN